MSRSPSRRSARRSSREWAIRGGIAAAVLVLGYSSTVQTLAYTLGKRAPERAYALAPSDGRIAAYLAEQRSLKESAAGDRRRLQTLAEHAIDKEPLALPALTALAINAELRGNKLLARQLIVHSNRLSRRDFSVRLWLIEDAVARGDVSGALRNYDIALRTSQSAPQLLYPVLAGAIADPAVASALARTLMQRTAWGSSFVDYLGSGAGNSQTSALFLRRLAASGYPVAESAQVGLLNALAGSGAYGKSWDFYQALHPGVARGQLRDPEFTVQPDVPSVFDWNPVVNETGINASIVDGVLDFAAPSTVGGVVLQQLQVLPAGRYRLDGISIGIDQPRASLPYWQLNCAVDGRELGRVEVPNSSANGGRFTGQMEIGSDCAAQRLSLVVRSSIDVGGVSGQIGRVTLTAMEPVR